MTNEIRLALEDADALDLTAEEADDNNWQDWAATMRQAATRIRSLVLNAPSASLTPQGAEIMTKPNAPEAVTLAGVECHVYPAEQYAAVDADVADERKDGRSAGAVARQMSLWAGIRGAENLRWMLDEMLGDANRQSFKSGQVERALHQLLFALHARPHHGYPLLTVEDAIAEANALLDAQMPGAEK